MYELEFYEDARGRCPIRDELLVCLNVSEMRKFEYNFALVEKLGTRLGTPPRAEHGGEVTLPDLSSLLHDEYMTLLGKGTYRMAKWSEVRKELHTLRDAEKDEIRDVAYLVADLITARKQAGLTQQQLADSAGIKQSALARIENGGAIPRIDTLYKIARALGMKIQLIHDEECVTSA